MLYGLMGLVIYHYWLARDGRFRQSIPHNPGVDNTASTSGFRTTCISSLFILLACAKKRLISFASKVFPNSVARTTVEFAIVTGAPSLYTTKCFLKKSICSSVICFISFDFCLLFSIPFVVNHQVYAYDCRVWSVWIVVYSFGYCVVYLYFQYEMAVYVCAVVFGMSENISMSLFQFHSITPATTGILFDEAKVVHFAVMIKATWFIVGGNIISFINISIGGASK